MRVRVKVQIGLDLNLLFLKIGVMGNVNLKRFKMYNLKHGNLDLKLV